MLIGFTQSLYAQLFTRVDEGFPVCHSPAAAWADIDLDDDLDVFLTGLDQAGNAVARIFENDNGSFVSLPSTITGVSSASCAFGDFNNDGLADLAVSGISGSVVSTNIYRNDGGGAFTNIGAVITGLSGGGIAWGDYNNDGWADLLVSGMNASQQPVTLLYNNAGGTSFTESGLSFTALSHGNVAWCDLDLDLDLDFVVTGADAAELPATIIYLNNGGSFSPMGAGLTGLKESSAAWGDYNNDTYPDLLISGAKADGSPHTIIYKNNGGSAFTQIAGPFSGIVNGSAIWGDFNNDGDLDFLIGGSYFLGGGGGPPVPSKPAELQLYINDGNDLFTMSKIQLSGVVNNAIVCGDYDDDSDLDLLVSGEMINPISVNYANAVIYRNETGSLNNPPNAPDGLTIELIGTEISMQWNAATDDKTPSEGLNYNLRIGTQDVNMDVFSALSNLDNGYRSIVSAGNTGSNTSWNLEGLGFGEYYVSVQAIDPCFAGSEFSVTQMIEIIPIANFTLADTLCAFVQTTITYTGNASPAAQYNWDFDGATVVSGSGQGPYTVYWANQGIKTVTLTVTENGVTSAPYTHNVLVIGNPATPGFIAGPTQVCQGTFSSGYVVPPISGAETYEWFLTPPGAGTINGNTMLSEVHWSPSFHGNAQVFVRGTNFCGPGPYSDSLDILVSPVPTKPGQPEGPSLLCLNNPNTSYVSTAATYAQGYQWYLLPTSAGVIFNNGLESEVDWNNGFNGEARVFLSGFNDCGFGPASDTLYVSVSIPPAAHAGDDQVVPFGNSTQLFGSGSGGSGSYDFHWMPDTLLVDPHVAEPMTIALEQSVPFNLFVTDVVSGCGSHDQVIVTVSGGPLNLNVYADPEVICEGEETGLLALAGGGSGTYTYNWTSDPPGFTANIAEPSDTPEQTTMYFAEVSDGSETLIDSIQVEVYPLPAPAGEINGPGEVCKGSQQLVYEIDAVANAEAYLWTLSEGLFGSSNSTSILVNFSESVVDASISVSPANDCGFGLSSVISVDILSNPVTPLTPNGPDSLCTTTDTISTFTLGTPVPTATGYEWMILPEEAGLIQGDGLTADVHWVRNWVGEAYIAVRAMNECGYSEWSEAVLVHTFDCLLISDPAGRHADIKVYPNPAKSVLHIEYTGLDGYDDINIQIRDIYGRMTFNTELISGQHSMELNLSHLPQGMYIMAVSGENGLWMSRKIILAR